VSVIRQNRVEQLFFVVVTKYYARIAPVHLVNAEYTFV
jgi:hypothetical protein